MVRLRLIGSIAMIVLAACQARAQDYDLFTVGAGDITGGYYATVKSLCSLINRQPDNNLRCSPDPTTGSIYNLAMLKEGELDFGLVQSDWQRAALDGTSIFAGQPPMSDLRSVMSLYPETFTILARQDSDIFSNADLIGKRIDIGSRSSGRNATLLELMRRLDVPLSAFKEVVELQPADSVQALCDGRIDATIFVTGHPSGLVADALTRCHARLARVGGPKLDAQLKASGDYVPVQIDAGIYPEVTEPIPSYAVYATVVTRAGTPDALVRAVVQTTLGNREKLGAAVPLLRGLDPARMRTLGLTAPLHPAAAAVFDEYKAKSGG